MPSPQHFACVTTLILIAFALMHVLLVLSCSIIPLTIASAHAHALHSILQVQDAMRGNDVVLAIMLSIFFILLKLRMPVGVFVAISTVYVFCSTVWVLTMRSALQHPEGNNSTGLTENVHLLVREDRLELSVERLAAAYV